MDEILSLRCRGLLILANLFLESVRLSILAVPVAGEAVPQEEVAPLPQLR